MLTLNMLNAIYIPRSNSNNANTSAVYLLNTRKRIPLEQNHTGNQSHNFPGPNLQTYSNQEECLYIVYTIKSPTIKFI